MCLIAQNGLYRHFPDQDAFRDGFKKVLIGFLMVLGVGGGSVASSWPHGGSGLSKAFKTIWKALKRPFFKDSW